MPTWLKRPSRLALRIYLFGLVQFVIVASVMHIDYRIRHSHDARNSAAAQASAQAIGPASGHVAGQAAVPGTGTDPNAPCATTSGQKGRRAPKGPPWFGWPLALVLVVVGVSSWLTARSIARPLEQLSDATRAFGSGHLDARAGLRRKDEIGSLAIAFDDMADRIAKLLLAERELLANVSHELRTPLARIRVALDLANEGDARMAIMSLGEIAQDLAELETIVDDVLASARLALDTTGPTSNPSFPMRAERVDSRGLLEKSAARFRAEHPDRALRVKLADDLPAINADAVLMRRVVDNLLDNAHKYTDKGDEPITLEARTDGDFLLIEVQDRGGGIAKEDLERLFEPFFRADRSRTRATGGLGLGLALARRVVLAHQGAISFESELGKGTTARVRIPCMT